MKAESDLDKQLHDKAQKLADLCVGEVVKAEPLRVGWCFAGDLGELVLRYADGLSVRIKAASDSDGESYLVVTLE